MATYRITRPTRTAEGYYVRTLGKAFTGQGVLRPKKFTLGRDPRQAELANLRLSQLWQDIERAHPTRQLLGDEHALASRYGEPHWDELTLSFAAAIRNGTRIRLPESWFAGVEPGGSPTGPADLLWLVRQNYPSIVDLLEVPQTPVVQMAREAAAEQARYLTRRAQDFEHDAALAAEIAEQPRAAAGGSVSVHEAIDACAEHVRQTRRREGKITEWGRKHAESMERLKRSLPDVPLAKLDYDAIEQGKHYWTARPRSRKSGRPIALETVRSHMKALRQLVQFLHRSSRFDWSQPPAVEESLRVNYRNLQSREEVARLKDGVKLWTVEQLVQLYAHARDRERVLLLLGLNCGFSHAEIVSLRMDELDLEAGTIKRVRGKTRVYGEWKLWPETIQAIQWWRRYHRKGKARQIVLVTERGRELTRQHIANLWAGLLDRVERDCPDARRLPFKHLRKTAGQFIREAADGETMAVFHARGQAVASDNLAEVYSNRLFPRVFEAQAKVHQRLEPMFAAAISPFTGFKRGGGRAASPQTQRMIRELEEQGADTADIAQAVGMTRQGIHRYLPDRRKDRMPRLTAEAIETIRKMRAEGRTLQQVAAEVGCSVATASRHCSASR